MKELKRILYVEDDSDIQAIAKIALEVVAGLEVKACSSGDEALREAEAFAPDLILLDVMMPGMDGPETLACLRRQPALADIPAAFMTAKVQPLEIQQFKAMGVVDVISKPFDPMALGTQVRAIWRAWASDHG